MAKSRAKTSLLLQRLKNVSRWLPAAQQHNERAVHQARVATRRLRETLPVVSRDKRARALRNTARRVRRALGPVRELDVVLANLAEFEAAGDASRAAIACLRSAATRERRRVRVDLRRRLRRCDLRKFREWAAEQASEGSSSSAGRARLARAQARCAPRAARLRAAIEGAASIYLPDRLHEVRIAAKKLRYAMELVLDLRANRRTPALTPKSRPARSGGTVAAGVRTLQQAQNLLGRMHDLEVLIARIRALQGTSDVTGLRLSAELDRFVRRLENECRELHGRHMAARGSLLALCNQAETGFRRPPRAPPAR